MSTVPTKLQSAKLADILSPIEPALAQVEERLGQQFGAFEPSVGEYVRYAIDSQGKRLRPTLALLAGGATGKIHDGHINLGVIVELIHLATLVHDDIMDGATMRRHKLTVSARWGNEIAVLLGDCLFAHSLRLAATFHTNEVCRRVAHATNIVCEGEILQTQRRFDLNLSIEQYLRIVEMKTAELFALSSELGAYINDASPAAMAAMRNYGIALGIAYQIYDDCVDIFEQENEAGKSLGTDLDKGKLTLPILTLLRCAPPTERDQIAVDLMNQSVQSHKRLASLVVKHRTLDASIEMIESYIRQALDALEPLSESAHSESLEALAQFLLLRCRMLSARRE